MDMHSVAGVTAAVVSVVSMAIYVRSILLGETKPNRVSYWIWFVLSLLIFLTYRKSGGTTVWLLGMYTLNPLIAAVLSIWWGEGTRLSKLDVACAAVAAVSIPLWWLLRSLYGDVPEVALPIFLLNMVADVVGAFPVFEKCWNRPENESRLSWLVSVLAATLNVAAVTHWGVVDIVWNAWMWAAAACFAGFTYFRPPSNVTAGSET